MFYILSALLLNVSKENPKLLLHLLIEFALWRGKGRGWELEDRGGGGGGGGEEESFALNLS